MPTYNDVDMEYNINGVLFLARELVVLWPQQRYYQSDGLWFVKGLWR